MALGVIGGLAVVVGCLTTWANVDLYGGSSRSYTGTHFAAGQVTLALGAAAALLALASLFERRLLFALPVLGVAALDLTLSKRSDVTDAFSASFHGFQLVNASAGGGLDLAIAGSAVLVITLAPILLGRSRAGYY